MVGFGWVGVVGLSLRIDQPNKLNGSKNTPNSNYVAVALYILALLVPRKNFLLPFIIDDTIARPK